MKHVIFTICFIPLFLWGQIRRELIRTSDSLGRMSFITGNNEPSIAINPKNPNDIWVAFNNSEVYHTADNGEKWKKVNVKPPQGFYGDPVIKVTDLGAVYLAHLSQNKSKKWPLWFDCIVFEHSFNGVEFESVCVGKNGNKMQDKPWFTVDEQVKSPFKNSIYLAWTEFDVYGSSRSSDSSRIRMARSSDGGISFTLPVTISDRCGGAKDDDETMEGATISVLPNGNLLCFWAGNDTLWMDCSQDAGKTWGKDVAISAMKGGWNIENLSGLSRSNGMPFSVADSKGNVYIAFGAQSQLGDYEIYAMHSADGGKTFSQPFSLVDEKYSEADQFCPFITMDASGQFARVVWYDKRHSETGRFADMYCTEIHGIKVKKNVRLTAEPFALPGNKEFMGDYIGLASCNTGNIAAYTTFKDDLAQVCIELAHYPSKLKKQKPPMQPVLVVNPGKKSDSLVIMTAFPGEKSFTFELKQNGDPIIQMVFENQVLNGPEYHEFYLKKSRLHKGLYTFLIRRKGKIIKKSLWID